MENSIYAGALNVIVDLYEIRASTLVPLQARQMEKVNNLLQYSFFTSAIAKICDKYKIKYEDIEEIIKKRGVEGKHTA